jgi:hypothetical protein
MMPKFLRDRMAKWAAVSAVSLTPGEQNRCDVPPLVTVQVRVVQAEVLGSVYVVLWKKVRGNIRFGISSAGCVRVERCRAIRTSGNGSSNRAHDTSRQSAGVARTGSGKRAVKYQLCLKQSAKTGQETHGTVCAHGNLRPLNSFTIKLSNPYLRDSRCQPTS